jgi:hypothetical protein
MQEGINDPQTKKNLNLRGLLTNNAVDPDSMGSLDLEGINDPQTKKKVDIFHFLKCWMFSFKG